MARKHDYQALPDGARQCSKCMNLILLGARPLIQSMDCPWALDEIKLKSVLGVDKKADYLKMLGIEIDEIPTDYTPPSGGDYLRGLGIDLSDLGIDLSDLGL